MSHINPTNHNFNQLRSQDSIQSRSKTNVEKTSESVGLDSIKKLSLTDNLETPKPLTAHQFDMQNKDPKNLLDSIKSFSELESFVKTLTPTVQGARHKPWSGHAYGDLFETIQFLRESMATKQLPSMENVLKHLIQEKDKLSPEQKTMLLNGTRAMVIMNYQEPRYVGLVPLTISPNKAGQDSLPKQTLTDTVQTPLKSAVEPIKPNKVLDPIKSFSELESLVKTLTPTVQGARHKPWSGPAYGDLFETIQFLRESMATKQLPSMENVLKHLIQEKDKLSPEQKTMLLNGTRAMVTMDYQEPK